MYIGPLSTARIAKGRRVLYILKPEDSGTVLSTNQHKNIKLYLHFLSTLFWPFTAVVSWFETSHTKNCISHIALCSQPVCPSLQDRDFCLLHPKDPLFQTFSGETLRYNGSEPLYPFFINECAYYEKGIALSLARKRRVVIPAIRVQTEQDQQSPKQRFASEEEE